MKISALSRLSLIAPNDDQLMRIKNTISHSVVVEGRLEIERVLNTLVNTHEPIPRTLDLIGHSTPDRSLLVLGSWVIDGMDSRVTAFFRGLADCELLPRIGVTAVRLLGCETGVSDAGRYTLLALADILELETFGTTRMIGPDAYDGAGFRDDHQASLISATELRRDPMMTYVKRGGEPYRRVLDVECLPASPLRERPAYERRIADLSAAREILKLVRRADGAQLPGFMGPPGCEIVLPSSRSGWFHRLQLVMDGEFVRVFPDGEDRPGVVFPVTDARALFEIVDRLPEG